MGFRVQGLPVEPRMGGGMSLESGALGFSQRASLCLYGALGGSGDLVSG